MTRSIFLSTALMRERETSRGVLYFLFTDTPSITLLWGVEDESSSVGIDRLNKQGWEIHDYGITRLRWDARSSLSIFEHFAHGSTRYFRDLRWYRIGYKRRFKGVKITDKLLYRQRGKCLGRENLWRVVHEYSGNLKYYSTINSE